MAEPIQIREFYQAAYRLPSITAYNRLEVSPRTANFDRSLKAEVRDALWMLTRQWQFGEFKGEDAATAVTTQIDAEHTIMERVSFPGNNVFPYVQTIPLETIVERETLKSNLYLAVQMGRYFIKLMKNSTPSLSQNFQFLLDQYPINYSPDSNDYEGIQLLISVKEKIFDGFLLYKDTITTDGESTVFRKWLTTSSIPDSEKLIELSELFKSWYVRNYSQPDEKVPSAWLHSKLEYQFALSSTPEQQQQKTLIADQYHEGHIDWYTFDLSRDKNVTTPSGDFQSTVEKSHLKSYIPSPVSFKGMPNPRFWMMEDSETDFGKISTSPTGLLHLLLAEFGLTCSNDWFMLPYELSINTLCEIKKIIVKDVFEQFTLILPAGRAPESQWQRWSMFTHTDLSNSSSNSNLFYLAPSITKVQEGEPLEEVNFLRDEMANMVWAVENTVPSRAGRGVSGKEMALKYEKEEPFVSNNNVNLRYVLGTTVPDNWIPFIPVHMENSNTEIRLQRASLPNAKGALGVMLTEKPAPYYIDEEIIQRSGIIVKQHFQRARWFNGETCLWLGRQKEAGRGEGWSNLKFDQIEDLP
jgi:hypothetical protein